MNYSKIYECDTANGYGIRYTIFVSGCEHHCKQCHNPSTWDFNYGAEWTDIQQNEMVSYLKAHSYVNGVTISGGDPLHPRNINTVLSIIKTVKNINKTVWVYTGYTYEYLSTLPIWNELSKYIDILVDGEFEIDKKDLRLLFRGSSNQRLIDVQSSIKENKVILYEHD